MTRIPSLILAATLLAATALVADPNLQTAVSSRTLSRGVAHAIVAQPGRVLTADGRGLAVFDAASLQLLTSFPTPRRSLDLAASGNDVYVLTEGGVERLRLNDAGTFVAHAETLDRTGYTAIATSGRFTAAVGPDVEIWENLSDHMAATGAYPLTTHATSAAFHGDKLYVVVENEGILVFDATAPGRLAPLAVIGVASSRIAISGDRLYIAAGGTGFFVYDIRDDANPVRLGHTGDVVDDQYVAVAGNLAYVGEAPDTIFVYDVSVPTAPRLLTTLHDPVSAIGAAGSRLYLAGQLVDKYHFTNETGAQLRAWDLSVPTSPVVAGEYRDGNLAGPLSGVATDGHFAYVADPPRFRVLDLTFPSAPREIASLEIAGLQDYVRIQGSRVAVFGRHSVNLIDVSNPAHPLLIGGWDGLGAPPSIAAFSGVHVVEGNPWSGFHVLDVSNPLNPIQIGGYKGHYYALDAVEDAAYIAELNAVRVMDLRDPHNVQIVSFIGVSARQVEVGPGSATHPRLLYIVTTDSVKILTLADTLNPQEAATLSLPPGGTIGAGNDVAFYAVGGSVYRIDVTNPSAPVVTLTGIEVSKPSQVAVAGDTLVIADSYDLQVFGDAPVLKKRSARK